MLTPFDVMPAIARGYLIDSSVLPFRRESPRRLLWPAGSITSYCKYDLLYAEQAQYHGVHAVDTRRHLGKYPRSTVLWVSEYRRLRGRQPYQ